jgi:hypothetical protein
VHSHNSKMVRGSKIGLGLSFLVTIGSLLHRGVDGARGDGRRAKEQPRGGASAKYKLSTGAGNNAFVHPRGRRYLKEVEGEDFVGGKAEGVPKQYPPPPPDDEFLVPSSSPPPVAAPFAAPPVFPWAQEQGQTPQQQPPPVVAPTPGWGTGWNRSPTMAPSEDQEARRERICDAASRGVAYPPSDNHVLIHYLYDVQAVASLSASAVPDAVATLLTQKYILPHCSSGGGGDDLAGNRRQRRALLQLQAGDVESVSAHQALLLLNKNNTCVEDCDRTSRWKGTNRVYFRDGYDITAETEATILGDIMAAFDSFELLQQVQTTDTNIQGVAFVTGSGETTAIVDEMTEPDARTGAVAASRRGMKPVGKAFLSIYLLAIAAGLMFAGYITMKKRQDRHAERKATSHVYLGSGSDALDTMRNEDEYVEEDNGGFVPFRPGKVRVSEPRDTQSRSGFGAETILNNSSSNSSCQMSIYTNGLKNDISITDPRETLSSAGYGAEMNLRERTTPRSQTTSRFTPDTLPNNAEAEPSVPSDFDHDAHDNSYSTVASPRNYRVPDTLDL